MTHILTRVSDYRLRLGLLLVAIALLACSAPSFAELNQNCVVSVLNRTVQVKPDGTWVLPNIPANSGPVRARATCVEGGITTAGQSDFFTVPVNGSLDVPDIVLGPVTPIPNAVTLSAGVTTLSTPRQTLQLAVSGRYADGSVKDITASSAGTQYRISNPALASVSAEGLVTALASGTVVVQAINEGTQGLLQLQIALGSDSDGDGIPDDVELRNGLDPRNPADALDDPDHDTLTNLAEYRYGTAMRNADTDSDGISDPEEIVAGADGFVTSPLLADSDGDGIPDAIEIATRSDPTNAASMNLAGALSRIELSPSIGSINVNAIVGAGYAQLKVTGIFTLGGSIDLTASARGSNYNSSNLLICNFGAEAGRVYGGSSGSCTITVSNSGFTATALLVVNVFSPGALSWISIPGYANNVDVAGDTAYVAAGSAGLQIIDVSNRQNPRIIGALDTTGNANDVRIVSNLAYVADGGAGLQIIDISSPSAPTLLGSYNTPGDATDLVVDGNRAYLADGAAGLHIIDISNPATPGLLGSYDSPGSANGVDISGNLAVLADGSSGIHIIDVSNPALPVKRATFASSDARDVVLEGNIAYLADYTGSLKLIDISNPASPRLLSSTSQALGGILTDVTKAGRFVLGADVFFVNGVPITDVSDPNNPRVKARLDFPARDDNGTGIAADGQYVYLTAANGTDTRLYIGQYLIAEDQAGIAPTVSITSPRPGDTFMEGVQIPITVNASDDIQVSAVNLLVNGQVVATDTASPYQFTISAPTGVSSLSIGVEAFDLAANRGQANTISVNIIPDPLTTVVGQVVGGDGLPIAGATLTTVGGRSGVTSADGRFSITGVPTILGAITVTAIADVNGTMLRGQSPIALPVPAGVTTVGQIILRGVQSLDAGDSHSCAVLNNGTVQCWGRNNYGQLGNSSTTDSPVPVTVQNVTTAIVASAGYSHSCAVLDNGTLQCWGDNSYGQLGNGSTSSSAIPVTIPGITTAVAVSAGGSHSCAVLSNGAVQCWGQNNYGQLGNGSTTSSAIPSAVQGINAAVAVAVSGSHSCALLSNGTLQCWGWNRFSQLGNGSTTSSAIPSTVQGISTAVTVTAAGNHSCAVLSNGTLQCWGWNIYGQLGNGSTTDSAIPVTVSGITAAIAVAAGTFHSCAVLSNGTLQCWGQNVYGPLGNGSTTDSAMPVTVSGITAAIAVAAGGSHGCAALDDGTLQCWGRNNYGQLGNGSGTSKSAIPVTASGLTTAIAVSAGYSHSCAVLGNGTLQCWGSNSSIPVTVPGITTAVAVSAGAWHSCAVLRDGTLQCWGANGDGQLGNGSWRNSAIPVTTSGITTAVAVSAGGSPYDSHSCAILSNGSVQCWGSNNYGQLGNGSTSSSAIPVTVSGITTAVAIAAGGSHNCALLSNGTLQCWGWNFFSQLGNGSTTSSAIPVTVSGITTAVAVAAGYGHSCVLLSNGTLQCWGYNNSGQLGNGSTSTTVSGITTAMAVTAGAYHSCAVLSNGTAQCWGYNTYGQLGNGSWRNSAIPVTTSGITTAVAVAAGGSHSCAVLGNGTVQCWGENSSSQLGNGYVPVSTTPVTVLLPP